MIYIDNLYTDVYFNLAAEEYLLKTFSDDIFMLWQNEPAVVIGKHQHVWTEVNRKFVMDNNIKVARRFSGGGAVYHDSGNLNLTFIRNGSIADFAVFTDSIIAFLRTMGLNAYPDDRYGIRLKELKISGSAQCVHRGRVMHHATLLFSTDLVKLENSLNRARGEEQDMEENDSRSFYVKSVRSPVTNIASHIPYPVDIDDFRISIMRYYASDANLYSFTDKDRMAIHDLREEKYAVEEWNYNNTYRLSSKIGKTN